MSELLVTNQLEHLPVLHRHFIQSKVSVSKHTATTFIHLHKPRHYVFELVFNNEPNDDMVFCLADKGTSYV